MPPRAVRRRASTSMFTAAPRTARSLLAAPTQYPRRAEPLSPRLSQVTASARREWLSSIAVFLPRRCLLVVSGVVCPAVPCEFTAAPHSVCSWAGLSPRRADPSSPHSSQATASVPLSPRFPTLAPLASPDAPCSYSLLVMAACVYGCTAYIPQLGALRPRRADPSSSRSSQARRADLSSLSHLLPDRHLHCHPPRHLHCHPPPPPPGPPPPFTGVQRCTGGFAVCSQRRPVIASLQPGTPRRPVLTSLQSGTCIVTLHPPHGPPPPFTGVQR